MDGFGASGPIDSRVAISGGRPGNDQAGHLRVLLQGTENGQHARAARHS